MGHNSRNNPTHLAVRRHGLPPIFALVGFTEPPLAAVGWAGESILRTGGSGEPSHESGRYVKNGRWRYSPRCPLDIRAAPPGVQGRYDLPKGSSWQLFPHPGADAESPDHPRFLLSSELGFLSTKTSLDPSRGPCSNSPPGCLRATRGPTAQSFRIPAAPPEPLRSSRPREPPASSNPPRGPTAPPPWKYFRNTGSKRNREFPRLRKFSPTNDEKKDKRYGKDSDKRPERRTA